MHPLLEQAAHPVFVEPSRRRVRVKFGGETIVDSNRPLLLHERGHRPVYYFPRDDVRMDLLTQTAKTSHCPFKGDATYWTVTAGDRTAEDGAWSYEAPIPESKEIAGHLAFYWGRMDAWYEEDDEVFVHARDPYSRVDVLRSSRHVQVRLGGEVVADSRRPSLLLETGLPTRYYVPQADVRMDLLEPTDHETRCPYKGVARYWTVRAGGGVEENGAWSYPAPIPEAAKIEHLVAFFDERFDVYVDGELQERPETAWSRR